MIGIHPASVESEWIDQVFRSSSIPTISQPGKLRPVCSINKSFE